jgi:hypothetical protein
MLSYGRKSLKNAYFDVRLIDNTGHLLNRNKAKFAVTGAISILSFVTLIGIEHNFANINAQTGMANNTLFVTGSASNQKKPDKVTVSLGVETIDDTVIQFIFKIE